MSGVVVVTGASGFIGSHVVESLLAEGRRVRAVVRDSRTPLAASVDRVLIPDLADVSATSCLAEALTDATEVVHLAGRAHQIRENAAGALEAYRRSNVEGTRRLLDAMSGRRIRRVVVLSTVAAAVTETSVIASDDIEPHPDTWYGISKREMEMLAVTRAEGLGLSVVLLRPPLVYGPGMKGNPLRLMEFVSRGLPVPVTVPEPRRSGLFVGNLVQAISLALRQPTISEGPFFVTEGPARTTSELVEAMARALDARARIVRVPRGIMHAVGKAGDVLSRFVPFPITSYEARRLTASVEVDGSRFWRVVGDVPRHSLGAGMQLTADWFRSRHSRNSLLSR